MTFANGIFFYFWQKETTMTSSTIFKTSLLRTILPLLQSYYGFDIQEFQSELSAIYEEQRQEGRINKELHEKNSYEKGGYKYIKVIDYALATDEKVVITTTNNFKKEGEKIIALCKDKIGEDETDYRTIYSTLVVIAAILNRNKHELSPTSDIDEINWNMKTYTLQVRPDLLQLYIARHKGKNKYHKSCYIQFGNAAKSVEIQTMYPWFEKMLDRYLYKFLGVENVKEANKELQQTYGLKVGAKLNETEARLIWGTYHLLQMTPKMKSLNKGSVTNEQSRFIHEYLSILGLIDPIEVESTSIRGRLKNLLKKYNTIEDVLDKRSYKYSPNTDSDLELF